MEAVEQSGANVADLLLVETLGGDFHLTSLTGAHDLRGLRLHAGGFLEDLRHGCLIRTIGRWHGHARATLEINAERESADQDGCEAQHHECDEYAEPLLPVRDDLQAALAVVDALDKARLIQLLTGLGRAHAFSLGSGSHYFSPSL